VFERIIQYYAVFSLPVALRVVAWRPCAHAALLGLNVLQIHWPIRITVFLRVGYTMIDYSLFKSAVI
jgi:hypothetical protein